MAASMTDPLLPSSLSSAIWVEFLQRLNQSSIIEGEDKITFRFEPFPHPPRPAEVLQAHEDVPNAVVDEEIVDPEEAFQKFLGKSFDVSDFSEELQKIKPHSEEVVHGWGHALKESFRERLGRLRFEVPEVVSALSQFKTSGDDHPNFIINLNASLAEMRVNVEDRLMDLTCLHKGYQRVTFGPDGSSVHVLEGFAACSPSRLSMSQILNPLLSHEKCLSDQVNPKNTSSVTAELDLQQIRSTERSELVKRIHLLQERLQSLSSLIASDSISERTTLKDVVTQLFTFCQILDDQESPDSSFTEILEARLRALQMNLELLEGVPPRPDTEKAKSSVENKYFAHLDDPEKRIAELGVLVNQNSGCTKFVDQLSTSLSLLVQTHRGAAKTLGKLQHMEHNYADLRKLLLTNSESMAQMEESLKIHRDQLALIAQTLKQ